MMCTLLTAQMELERVGRMYRSFVFCFGKMIGQLGGGEGR